MKISISLFLLFLFFNLGYSQIKISGKITDKDALPVVGANVVIKGTIDGATADEKGYFEFETSKKGSFILICTSIGFKEFSKNINISNDSMVINIVMETEGYKTDEIIVTASSFTSGENSKVTLTPLEIVRIPGADADLFRAITTFPGSNQVDEGSRIAVRGGDPNEVLTFLDNASLYNPFIFQDAYNTQSFSTINPWGLRGINFSSGGFSARFGNVLSAVLDLQSYDLPSSNGIFAFIGLANASLQGAYVSPDTKFGATFATYQTYIKPFLDLNGITEDYSKSPTATGFGGTLVYKTSETGILKLYANYDHSKVGIRNSSPSFNGYVNSEANSFFTNLKYSVAPTSVSLLNVSASFSNYNSISKYGVLDNSAGNLYSKIRADFSTPLNEALDFSAGTEFEYNKYESNGKVPLLFYNLRPDAPFFELNSSKNSGRLGLYSELKSKISKYFAIVGGIRSDYYSISKKVILDPRLSLVFRLSEHSYIKGSAGIYHQNPALEYFLESGKTDLLPEQSNHYILGYEYNRDGDYIFRVEGYYKDYKNLLLFDRFFQNFSSSGYGFAKGVDLFLKVRLKPKFNGWISYAIADSRRKQFYATNVSSANYDITHTLSVVGEYNITERLTIGATYKYSTGKPFTPVTGSIFEPSQDVYIPFFAEVNSGRMPDYRRFDMNMQYIFNFLGKFAVAVVAVNNILNVNNVFEYTYTPDYSKKIGISYNSPRIIYVGLGLQF